MALTTKRSSSERFEGGNGEKKSQRGDAQNNGPIWNDETSPKKSTHKHTKRRGSSQRIEQLEKKTLSRKVARESH